jgi:uncharacterized protein
MSLLVGLQASVSEALKAGDRERVSVLRVLVDELQKEAKQSGKELDEAAELAVLKRELKRRQESIEAFRAGGREDLIAPEELAVQIIENLLPTQMDEAELARLVDQAIADTGATSVRDMGKVMAAVMAQGGVRIDGKQASSLVKERLSA